jgi:hypothetical protein
MRVIALLLLLAAAPACRKTPTLAEPPSWFPRAIIIREDVAEALKFESDLARRYDTPPPATQPWFNVLPGDSKVLVVAGHATSHAREGRIKGVDGGTGSLAFMLNRLVGCPVIHTNYQSPSDPNYYDDNAFKKSLQTLVAQHKPTIVLDLHASDASRPYDIDFGTIGNTSFLKRPDLLLRLFEFLRTEGMRNFSQDYFPASRDGTVTRFVNRLNVPCVQLECNQNWLLTSDPPSIVQNQRFAQLLQGLVRFVRSVDAEQRQRN